MNMFEDSTILYMEGKDDIRKNMFIPNKSKLKIYIINIFDDTSYTP